MLTRYSNNESSSREATGNTFTAALIIASGLLLYAAMAYSVASQPSRQASAQAQVEHVVVTAPSHVS